MLRTTLGYAATALIALFLALGAGSAAAQCVGDCDGDNTVEPGEIRDAVQIALLELPPSACTAYSGTIEVDDLVDAVINAIGACPEATPTVTSTVTPTATITPTPTRTNTPGGVSNAVAGGAAVIAKSLGGIPSLVTAIVTGLTKGTPSEPVDGQGSAAGACPLGGTATRDCTPQNPGAQLALGLSSCAVAVPGGTQTFNTMNGPITLASGAPATCPMGVSLVPINALADVRSLVTDMNDELQLDSRAQLAAIVIPSFDFSKPACASITGAQLTVTGLLSSSIPGGSGASLNLLQTGVVLAISAFNADCVPVQYTLTFNGHAQVRDTSTQESAEVTFSSFVVRVNATSVPTTLDLEGGLNFDCINGNIVLDTTTPLTSIPGSLCPTSGVIQITSPEGPGTITYASDGSVQVDNDNDGTTDDTFDSCIDPMLQLCPDQP